MSWLFLFLAIISEVTGTTCMKLSAGFTQLLPSVSMVIFYGISLTSLTFAIKKIDVSVAYAIWSGLGTVLIATIGILWFKEPANALKIISIGLVIIGVIGLNISGGGH
ncbi:DMT family transporter [Nostoc sp.]|uniref:DMT family transporter n=1 Tax=Nostoc sp. TaxID=1180 RepID=UPI002FFBB269